MIIIKKVVRVGRCQLRQPDRRSTLRGWLQRPRIGSVLASVLLGLTITTSAAAQITGGITGTVRDAQGGVIPGATVTVISDSKGTTIGTVTTGAAGNFVIANISPDTYTIQVEMPSFRTLRRPGITISPGPITSIGALTIDIGGANELVTVTGEAPLIQSVSGEKSFTVTSEQMSNLPINGRDFGALLQLTPGVNIGTGLTAATVQGGAGQTNFMMDGVVNMEPGINRQAQRVSVDAIEEVRVLTSSYQAEFGRAAGLQVNAVTKSGTNKFRGSLYDVERNSKWNSNSKTNILNGDAKAVIDERDWGWTLGGPIGKPGGNNKLFFFWNQEYNPRTRGGNVVTYRVPTALERQGDFSQSLDNNGNLFPYIKDPLITGTCSAADTRACFQDGGVVGRIPANRLYQTGLNILKWWPSPNLPATQGVAYNYQTSQQNLSLYGYAPVIKLDYQATPNLRGTYRYAMYQQPTIEFPNTLPGFSDVTQDNMGIWGQSILVNWTLGPTTFVEASYGRNSHHQEGCSVAGGSPTFCTGGLSTSPSSNRNNVGMGSLPYLFPDAFAIDPSYHAYEMLNNVMPPFWDGNRASIVPTFQWGNRVANAPPNISWPNFIQNQVTQTFSTSVTKVAGSHTLKAGFFFIESVQQDGRSSMQGTYSFANNTSNPLDSQFGFANAALGIFDSVTQTSRWTEGADSSMNNEWYIQDNWRVKPNLTLDVGVRFVMQRPVYDLRGQGANFLPDTYVAGQAPALYQYGCANGVYPCTGANRVAINPITGQVVGTSAQASVIVGTVVPGSGNGLNGLHVPGTDIDSSYYRFPKLAIGPRWGLAWDVSGSQKFVIRGGGGVFYDRTQTQEFYTVVNNPPTSQTVTVRYGELQNLSSAGLTSVAPSTLRTYQYEGKLPTSVQWNGGVQMVLPWSAALDVSYTGQHAWNKWTNSNINSIDIGAAFNPALQDPSQAPAGVTTSLVNTNPNQTRFYKGYSTISHIQFDGWQTYHSIQVSLTRRLRDGISFGFADTIALSDVSSVATRYEHDYANRTLGVRADQDEAQALLGNNNPARHQIKANFIYQLPRLEGSTPAMKVLGHLVNDWQLSGIWTGISATPYTVGYAYSNGGGNINLTGSPDYAARVVLAGDPGTGCNSDPLKQFNTSAFRGPAVGSVGLESGNDYLYGCFLSQTDLAISRTIKVGGSRNIQLRLDLFNAFNQATVINRNTTMQLNSPADPTTITNLPFNASGTVVDARSRPRGAGFGVGTDYQAPRTIQLQMRFAF